MLGAGTGAAAEECAAAEETQLSRRVRREVGGVFDHQWRTFHAGWLALPHPLAGRRWGYGGRRRLSARRGATRARSLSSCPRRRRARDWRRPLRARGFQRRSSRCPARARGTAHAGAGCRQCARRVLTDEGGNDARESPCAPAGPKRACVAGTARTRWLCALPPASVAIACSCARERPRRPLFGSEKGDTVSQTSHRKLNCA